MAQFRKVRFGDGRTVKFRVGSAAPRRRRSSAVTGTPYLFAAGAKIGLPRGARKGALFKRGGKNYLAVIYTNAHGDRIAYGQPVKLTGN